MRGEDDRKSSSLPPSFFKCKSIKDLTGRRDSTRKTSSTKRTDVLPALGPPIPDNESLSTLYQTIFRKQKELEVEICSLQKKLNKSNEENVRLENERARAFALYKQQQEELNEMQTQHECDAEVIRSLKIDLDKLYMSFKNYRETKEKEIKSIIKQKANLESMLTRFDCFNAEDIFDKLPSIGIDDSVPPSPAFTTGSIDWFGSSEFDSASQSNNLSSSSNNLVLPSDVLQKVLKNVSFLGQLGMLNYHRGNLDIAVDLLNKALKAKEALIGSSDGHELTKELSNLAFVLTCKKQWTEAEQILSRLLDIRRKIGDESGFRETGCNLADVYLKSNRFESALPLLEDLAQRLKITVGPPTAPHSAVVPNNGEAGSHVHQPSSAAAAAAKLDELSVPTARQLKLASVLCRLAAVYGQLRFGDKAQSCLEELFEICRDDDSAFGRKLFYRATKIAAKLELDKGNIEDAARLFMQSGSSSGSQSSNSRKSSAPNFTKSSSKCPHNHHHHSQYQPRIFHKSFLSVPSQSSGAYSNQLVHGSLPDQAFQLSAAPRRGCPSAKLLSSSLDYLSKW